MRAEDFTSNDEVQIRLQREFQLLHPKWFYQVKRGEWGRMIGGPPQKEIYRDLGGGFRKITSKEVAQSVMAFAGYPGEAKDGIGKFLNRESIVTVTRDSEINYEKIFTEYVRAAQLLLPAVIQRRVRERVNEDKEKYEWLEYARYHLIWLIGEILRDHYSIEGELFPHDRAHQVTVGIDDWFDGIYDIALIAVDEFVEGLKESREFRGYRELFRTPMNYRQIQSKVTNAIRLAQRISSPMAHLPA